MPRPVLYASLSILLAGILVFSPLSETGIGAILRNGFEYMGVFFHEIGHSLFALFYGIPSFPIFDFEHGGGYAVYLVDRSWGGQIAVWAGVAYGLYVLKGRADALLFYPVLFLTLMLSIWAFTDYYEDVILFMGHGTEAVIGGFLLARGLFGILLTSPKERWLNVFVGAFFIFKLVDFGWKLLHDPDFQDAYDNQKGQHGFGDLARIAGSHGTWTQAGVTEFLMGFTVFCAFAVPAYIYILWRRERAWIEAG